MALLRWTDGRSPRRRREDGRDRDAAAAAGLLLAIICCGGEAMADRTPRGASGALAIDGSFEDWDDARINALTNPDDAPPGAAVDLRRIAWQATGEHLHLKLDFDETVNLQQLDGHLHLLIDSDGRIGSGSASFGMQGVDAIVTFSPRAEGWQDGMGVGLSVAAAPQRDDLGPYDVGVLFAPTYASDKYEIRIDRGAPLPGVDEFLGGDRARLKLVLTSKTLEVQDETTDFTVNLPNLADEPWRPDDRAQRENPLRRAVPGAIRVVVWNGERGALLSRSEITQPILRALNPDVVLLQELAGGTNVQQLDAFFEGLTPRGAGRDGAWRIIFGEGGGNLRCAVAARAGVERDLFPQPVHYGDGSNHTMRFAGGVLDLNGRTLLVTSVHLKCCGRMGDESDFRRRVEATRLRAIIDEHVASGGVDGVVIGGDFNLVGGFAPMAIAKAGLDMDGSDLAIADVLQFDRRTNATWEDPGQPFIPGRLDYLLYSDASLRMARGFVLDTRDIAPRWLKEHGLNEMSTAEASDHLPIVVDLVWEK